MGGDGRAGRTPRTRRTGATAPVLLVTGAGMAAATRLRTLPVLAERFPVIAMHAGGVSGDPRDALAALADQAVARLDEAGASGAHVYGLSFGGMIAQEIALRHPERVRSLVLGATTAGGVLRVPPDEAAREFIERRAEMPVLEGLWASVPYSYALVTRRRRAHRIGEDIAERLKSPPDLDHHRVQRGAALRHDAAGRLERIGAATLVLHGEEDRMMPPENGRLLAGAIPGARLLTVPDAAHLYPSDEPGADREVVRFMLAQQPSRTRPARSGSAREARA